MEGIHHGLDDDATADAVMVLMMDAVRLTRTKIKAIMSMLLCKRALDRWSPYALSRRMGYLEDPEAILHSRRRNLPSHGDESAPRDRRRSSFVRVGVTRALLHVGLRGYAQTLLEDAGKVIVVGKSNPLGD